MRVMKPVSDFKYSICIEFWPCTCPWNNQDGDPLTNLLRCFRYRNTYRYAVSTTESTTWYGPKCQKLWKLLAKALSKQSLSIRWKLVFAKFIHVHVELTCKKLSFMVWQEDKNLLQFPGWQVVVGKLKSKGRFRWWMHLLFTGKKNVSCYFSS
jgi:hypothetical protein